MISYEIDPSLHTTGPQPQSLGDGFSPPQPDEPAPGEPGHAPAAEAEPMLGDISPS